MLTIGLNSIRLSCLTTQTSSPTTMTTPSQASLLSVPLRHTVVYSCLMDDECVRHKQRAVSPIETVCHNTKNHRSTPQKKRVNSNNYTSPCEMIQRNHPSCSAWCETPRDATITLRAAHLHRYQQMTVMTQQGQLRFVD